MVPSAEYAEELSLPVQVGGQYGGRAGGVSFEDTHLQFGQVC